jgi:hypothetical protein
LAGGVNDQIKYVLHSCVCVCVCVCVWCDVMCVLVGLLNETYNTVSSICTSEQHMLK